jgi:hypothetical protein
MIYIFDIDGTLADLTHRLHHIQKTPKDWTGFFSDCADDSPIPEVVKVAQSLSAEGHEIVYSTGRSEDIRRLTDEWMDKYHIPVGEMFMRKAGDHREDNVVKSELLDSIISIFGKDIAGVFEDRQQVVDMYRSRGLRVFQVAPGNF